MQSMYECIKKIKTNGILGRIEYVSKYVKMNYIEFKAEQILLNKI